MVCSTYLRVIRDASTMVNVSSSTKPVEIMPTQSRPGQATSRLGSSLPMNIAHSRQSRGRREGKVVLITVILLAVIGGGAAAYYVYGGFGGGKKLAQPLTQATFRGPFDHIVLEQGEIESSSNIDIICEVKANGGSGTPILWVIDEGTYVKKGDKLVELDSSALENQLKTQRIAVASAEALVISSEAAVRTAEIGLQEYLEGTYLSERKAILSEIAVAEQELRKAELKLASARRLAAKGMLKGLQIEAEEFSVANAKNVLESAQARLRVLDELTKEKNKVQFTSDIEAAKARFRSDESVLSEEQDKLIELEDQIAKCVIFSPAEGVVVHNNSFSSRGGAEFVVEEGASVRERQTIIKLPDPSRMQVKANVNESQITLIAEGMAVKIRVSAVPDVMLAKVKRVSKYAEPGSFFSSSVKEYATYIEILNPPAAIRTGMTAEVRIFVEQLPDALQIPVHGVYEYKGHHFCLVKDGADWRTTEVEIGATNDKMVTIESGLAEGDLVGLSPRSHLDLMELPDIEDVSDREKLAEIGANAAEPTKPADLADGANLDGPGRGGPPGAGRGGPGGMTGEGPAGGGPPGGRNGPAGGGQAGGGGPGGASFDPAAIVDKMMTKYDANSDGKIDASELSSLDSAAKDRLTPNDSNGDGSIDKQEMLKGFKSMSGGR